MFYFYGFIGLLGLLLQILVLAAILRYGWRTYPLLFVYLIVLVVTTAFEAQSFFHAARPGAPSTYYWVADFVRQALLYLLVISLIEKALRPGPRYRFLQHLIVAGALLFVVFSLYWTYQPRFGRWMTEFSRNLGFLAVLLTFGLWAALLANRQANVLLLLVTSGLGIQMAGKAIGHALRQLSQHLILPGNLVIIGTHLVCLYIWLQAFRSSASRLAGASSRQQAVVKNS